MQMSKKRLFLHLESHDTALPGHDHRRTSLASTIFPGARIERAAARADVAAPLLALFRDAFCSVWQPRQSARAMLAERRR